MAGTKSVDLTKGKVSWHVLRMLGPFTIAVVALISTGIVDSIYLGNLDDPLRPNLGVLALAAVTVAHPMTFFGNSANIGLGAGTMSAISRAIGQNDHAKARRHSAAAMVFALIVMTILVTGLYIAMPFVLPFFTKDTEVLRMAELYLVISLPGLVIITVAMICNNTLRAGGEALAPSSIMILGAVINIILDPFLIFGWGPFPRLEVQGAAVATVVGNVIAAIYGIYLLRFSRKAIDFSGMTLASLRRASRIIGGVGIPAAVTNTIVPFGTMIAVAIIGHSLTTPELAAFGVSRQVEAMSVGVLFALSACIGAITGQNGGAGRTDRVRATFKFCYLVCLVWSTFMALVLAVFAVPIADLFTQSDAVINATLPYFYIVPITVFAYGFVFVSAAGLNALGRPIYGLVYTIIRSIILYVGFIWIGVMIDGIRGAYIGIAAANLVSGFIAAGWTLRKVPMSAKKS